MAAYSEKIVLWLLRQSIVAGYSQSRSSGQCIKLHSVLLLDQSIPGVNPQESMPVVDPRVNPVDAASRCQVS